MSIMESMFNGEMFFLENIKFNKNEEYSKLAKEVSEDEKNF